MENCLLKVMFADTSLLFKVKRQQRSHDGVSNVILKIITLICI